MYNCTTTNMVVQHTLHFAYPPRSLSPTYGLLVFLFVVPTGARFCAFSVVLVGVVGHVLFCEALLRHKGASCTLSFLNKDGYFFMCGNID